MPDLGLYLHVPFCRVKCSYCDFVSYPGRESLFSFYISAVAHEGDWYGEREVDTVYIGGGTPTALGAENLLALLQSTLHVFIPTAGCEITVEANPGTVDEAFLRRLRAGGVNRLSLGVQSLDNGLLTMLGRIHSAQSAVDCVKSARRAGFRNINMDLLFGLPTQSLAQFQATLKTTLELGPEHLSLYALTLEEGTPMADAIAGGELPMPDADLAADMYEFAQEQLAGSGYMQYEISNWAQSAETQCAHNLAYWQRKPYVGLGAGAHSFLGDLRFRNTHSVEEYIALMEQSRHRNDTPPNPAPGPAAVEMERIERPAAMAEMMFLGLRMTEGIRLDTFHDAFGTGLMEIFGDAIRELEMAGLLEVDSQRVGLTQRGRLVGNQVFYRFLPDS